VAAVNDMVETRRVQDGVVIRPIFDPVARSFDTITDAEWERAWECPLRATVEALQQAYSDGLRRIVVVVPVVAMSGGARYAHVAAPAEAVRVLVKSAARQWGAVGVTVNAVAVATGTVVDDAGAAGPVALAPPALDGADAESLIRFLCSDASCDVTGQTITVDGGSWM
jgi:NAD(P)-dependent dehydrogenase (short-subunit alcohol dehydrogenase family)